MTDVAGDDGLLLRWTHAERVVYHGFLHWVQLRVQRTQTHALNNSTSKLDQELKRSPWKHTERRRHYRVEIGKEAERRGAVDPEGEEVVELTARVRLRGPSRQGKGAQQGVDLALGEGT